MPHHTDTAAAAVHAAEEHEEYVPPRIERLGTLAELTQGGLRGPDDGFGGAGDDGSV